MVFRDCWSFGEGIERSRDAVEVFVKENLNPII
jgi:hypothetical protein